MSKDREIQHYLLRSYFSFELSLGHLPIPSRFHEVLSVQVVHLRLPSGDQRQIGVRHILADKIEPIRRHDQFAREVSGDHSRCDNIVNVRLTTDTEVWGQRNGQLNCIILDTLHSVKAKMKLYIMN